eukprot:TRINITY_DN844_c0_g1_i1.p1 TRINITY_DN844_c0_g1~~TRINITY_DN844_c0_g1_i1.p1  ORF type:complete len:469 (+),score=74.16 TRINITY_DN844_c0_g1_i1:157-1563(+)
MAQDISLVRRTRSYPNFPSSCKPGAQRTQQTPTLSDRILSNSRSSSFIHRKQAVSMLPCDDADYSPHNHHQSIVGIMCPDERNFPDFDGGSGTPRKSRASIFSTGGLGTPRKARASIFSNGGSGTPRKARASITSIALPDEDDRRKSMQQHAIQHPNTRVFNVGFSRNMRKVKLALGTKDDDAKLRRFEQVFNDKRIQHDQRFCDDLTAMEEEFRTLQFRAARAEQARLDRCAEEERQKIAGSEAQRQFLQDVEEKKRQVAEKKRLELLAAEQRRREAMERAQLKRRRIMKMKMASHLLGAEAELGEDEVDENGEVDLRKSRVWNPHYMWCCDIIEREGEKANDFLFLADLSKPTGGKRSKTSQRSGRCIFDSVMYDLARFEPDYREDGNIVFELRFGVNTKERPKVPQGWAIDFEVKQNERGGFEGTCHTSWWGVREVAIMPYMFMTPEELANFPDPVAKYFKSGAT